MTSKLNDLQFQRTLRKFSKLHTNEKATLWLRNVNHGNSSVISFSLVVGTYVVVHFKHFTKKLFFLKLFIAMQSPLKEGLKCKKLSFSELFIPYKEKGIILQEGV